VTDDVFKALCLDPVTALKSPSSINLATLEYMLSVSVWFVCHWFILSVWRITAIVMSPFH